MTTTSPRGRMNTALSRAAIQTRQPMASAVGKDSPCHSVTNQLEADHEALLPDLSDPRVLGEELVQERSEKSGSPAYSFQDGLRLEDPQARHRGGATDGVPGERVPVKERLVASRRVVEGIVDPLGGNGGREREIPAGDALPQRHDVGHHPFQVTGEHFAGPSESGCHLVGDEQDIMVVA